MMRAGVSGGVRCCVSGTGEARVEEWGGRMEECRRESVGREVMRCLCRSGGGDNGGGKKGGAGV